MRAMLVHQGLAGALDSEGSEEKQAADLDPKDLVKKQEMMDRAHSLLILNLTDKVLQEVSKERTASGVWLKLESLYMTKSLANRLYMKQKLYSYKIVDDKSIGEQLDEFNKALDDLENIDVKMDDEDKAIILLNALPSSFDHLKDVMLYGRETTITLEEVQCALKAKELQKSSLKQDVRSQALTVGKFKKKKKKEGSGGQKQKTQKGSENGRKETRTCHYCKKPGHLKKNCFSWKRKQEQDKDAGGETADVAQEVEVAEALNVSDVSVEESWIMDSACSFHICSQILV